MGGFLCLRLRFGGEELLQCQHFDSEAFGIVFPADDEIATCGIVMKTAGGELEFDADASPFSVVALSLCFAIGVAGADDFDLETQLFGHHSEEHDNALLVDGGVEKVVAGDGIAEEGFVGIWSDGRLRREVHHSAQFDFCDAFFVGLGFVAAASHEFGVVAEELLD